MDIVSLIQVLILATWSYYVGKYAVRLQRDIGFWFILSLLISPLLTSLILWGIGVPKDLRVKKYVSKTTNAEIGSNVNNPEPELEVPASSLQVEMSIPISFVADKPTPDLISDKLTTIELAQPLPKEENIIDRKEITLFKNLQLPQKIIYSLSLFSLFFILCFVYAKSTDYKVRLTETWFIWVSFIITQTWLQNKLWSLGSSFSISFNQSKLLKIKRWFTRKKKQVLITISILSVIVTSTYLIIAWIEYTEKQKTEQLANLKSLPDQSAFNIGIAKASAKLKYIDGYTYLNLEILLDKQRPLSKETLKRLFKYINTKKGEHLEDESSFIEIYSDKNRFINLYNELVAVGYIQPGFQRFYNIFALKIPKVLKLTFTEENGNEIKSFHLDRLKSMKAFNGKDGDCTFNGKIEKSGFLSEDEYLRIKNWKIEQ